MDRIAHLAALERDGMAFADSCEAAGLTTSVAACPEWTVADLAWHLGEVHHFWRTMVAGLCTSPDGYEQPQRPDDDGLIDFYREGLQQTLAVLAAADPEATMWTWTSDHTAGFVVRRMAHETAVHRWDADQAAGRPTPIEPLLASDGIDEFLEHFLGDPVEGRPRFVGSVHLHCGDVPGEWTVRPTDDGELHVTREHAKGDAAIRGGASDILLALWRRQPLTSVDVVGDAEIAARFVALTSLD